MIPVKMEAQPGHDFSDPFGLMRDCHRRIERFLDQLIDVAQHAWGEPLTPMQQEELDVALRYFQKAAPLHTEDEEASLFPHLRATNDPRAAQVLAIIEGLEADHKAADEAHAEVERLGRRWLEKKVLSPAETQHLLTVLRHLRATYEQHIALEDNQVFPLAVEVLSAAVVDGVGREMAQRRGLNPDEPSPVSRCTRRRLERRGLLTEETAPASPVGAIA